MFKGVFTALITPFNEDGSIDKEALIKLVEDQIENKVDGLVPMGTTGESPTVNHEEHIKVIKIVADQANGRVPVIAGTGSNCTKEAISLTLKAQDAGANATLQVAPYYNKPSQEGFYQHFMTIADSIKIPVIVYNIPGRSAKNIETPVMLKLAKHDNIKAVKEASGDIAQVMDIIAAKPADFDVLSGDDNLAYAMTALGGTGVVSVASNIIPGEMSAYLKVLLAGDFAKGKELHYKYMPLFKSMFIDTNPVPIKTAMAMKGMAKEVFRLPMCPLSEENKQKLTAVLKEFKIL